MSNSASRSWSARNGRSVSVPRSRPNYKLDSWDGQQSVTRGFLSLSDILAEFENEPGAAERLPEARRRFAARARPYSKLAALRLEQGLSQSQLAILVGTVQPRLSLWESGKEEPSLRYAHRLAEVLRTSLDDLARIILDD
jgi:DNA-binding XRE family transcriptional regulator